MGFNGLFKCQRSFKHLSGSRPSVFENVKFLGPNGFVSDVALPIIRFDVYSQCGHR